MGVITIDFGQAESSGFEPVEPGEYAATVTACKLSDKAGGSGYHYIEMEYQGKDPKRKYWANYSLSPKAMWNLKQALVALGVEVDDGPLELDPDDVIGRDCVLVIKQEEWNGRIQNKVESVKPSDGHDW